ncbi:hypothetical protein [Aquisphaera giovannonii]|nr:hypothetical protein [Aquisphaera giovannonii]
MTRVARRRGRWAIDQASTFRHRMGFGIAVHATAIREAVEMLDARP